MKFNGLTLSDFATHDEAFAAAEDYVKQNQVDFEHDGLKEDHDNPLLVRFRYFEGLGKKRTWNQSLGKKLEGHVNLSNKKKLEDAKSFMEAGIGIEGESGEPGSASADGKCVTQKWEQGRDRAVDLRMSLPIIYSRRNSSVMNFSYIHIYIHHAFQEDVLH